LRIGPINGKFLKRYYAWYLMLLLATWAKIVNAKKKKKKQKNELRYDLILYP
jgi:hypothetical protein